MDYLKNINWRNAESYPETKEYLTSQWAWEFLRRREDYQRDWQDFCEEIAENIKNIPLLTPYIEDCVAIGGVGVAVKSALSSLTSSDETIDYLKKCDPELKQWELMRKIDRQSRCFAFDWNLDCMLDPSSSLATKVNFSIKPVQSELGGERKKRIDLDRWLYKGAINEELMLDDSFLNEPFFCHLLIDMRFPIGAVKAAVTKEIERRFKDVEKEEFKRVKTRLRDDKYLTYLRILDAKKVGATNEEIGKELFARQFEYDMEALKKQVHNAINGANNAKENYFEIYASNPL